MVAVQLVLGLLTILFGVLVLAFPAFLRWVIGGYFLITGLITVIYALM